MNFGSNPFSGSQDMEFKMQTVGALHAEQSEPEIQKGKPAHNSAKSATDQSFLYYRINILKYNISNF